MLLACVCVCVCVCVYMCLPHAMRNLVEWHATCSHALHCVMPSNDAMDELCHKMYATGLHGHSLSPV